MWLSLLCGVAFGAVVVLLLRDRRGNNGGQALGNAPINIWNVGSGAQPMTLPAGGVFPSMPTALSIPGPHDELDPGLKTKMSTVTLSETSSNRLLRASGGRRWAVQVRTIGPPGAYAMFSTEPEVLVTSPTTAPANAIVVPASRHHDLLLEPGDYLFARGSTPGVVVSLSARQLA